MSGGVVSAVVGWRPALAGTLLLSGQSNQVKDRP